LQPDGVSVIEWAERLKAELPLQTVSVQIEFLSEMERRIIYDDFGA
jgi:tRNA A37 threonylcarbamoyladenosine biosynthesis protein TsaE